MALTKVKLSGLEPQNLGRRNIIINGAMNVAQRATSATGLGGTNNDYQTVDRFKLVATGTAGRVTMSQADSGLSGFKKCLKLQVTTADTSIASGELFGISQAIEGQDLQQLKKGTSDAEQITLSYYVKGNAAANYTVEIADQDNTRHNTQSFSVTTDWVRKVHTFAADTTGALDNDNAASLQIAWFLHAGSDFNGGTFTENTWASRTNANRVDSNDTSFFDSTDRTFEITGVQLEVGSVATEFEHRPFAEESYLCQRYYQEMGSFPIVIIGSNNCQGTVAPKIVMRSAPTVSTDSNQGRITDCNAADFTTGGLNPAVTANAYEKGNFGWISARFQGFGFNGGTSGDPGVYLPTGTNGNPLQMDAEL